LLLAAQLGGTDEDLADELGISLSVIKKAWHSIYDRVCAHDPELVPATTFSEEGAAGRGKTKKQRLLAIFAIIPKNSVRRRRRSEAHRSNADHCC